MTIAPAPTASLAGHGRRIAAAALDFVYACVLIGAFVAGGLGLGAAAGGDTDSDGWEELGWILLGSVVGFMFGVVLWVALTVWLVRRPGERNGQTLGKQSVGIRAARVDGSEIGVGWALLREILAKGLLIGATSSMISGFLGFIDAGVVGFIGAACVWYGPALFDEQRRGLHDRLCGTLVVLAGRRADAAAAPVVGDDLWPATR